MKFLIALVMSFALFELIHGLPMSREEAEEPLCDNDLTMEQFQERLPNTLKVVRNRMEHLVKPLEILQEEYSTKRNTDHAMCQPEGLMTIMADLQNTSESTENGSTEMSLVATLYENLATMNISLEAIRSLKLETVLPDEEAGFTKDYEDVLFAPSYGIRGTVDYLGEVVPCDLAADIASRLSNISIAHEPVHARAVCRDLEIIKSTYSATTSMLELLEQNGY